MPVQLAVPRSTVDPERIRQELADSHFEVDEFLESFIKQSAVQSPVAPVYSTASAANSQNDIALANPYALELRDTGDYGYDAGAILQRLNDLFNACVHINAKALVQHKHAESELTQAEDTASEKISQRYDMVRRRLKEVDDLEEQLRKLSTKFSHLGTVLTTITEPQERLKKVHKLLSHFVDLNQEKYTDLTYPDLVEARGTMEDYQNAAETLLELSHISATLGSTKDNPYKTASVKIKALYEDVENDLIALFTRAHQEEPMDISLMQQSAAVLHNFPAGYGQVIHGFVQRCRETADTKGSEDPFRRIVAICDATYKLVYEIFPSPDVVMDKLITHVVCVELETNIRTTLDDCASTLEGREMFVTRLADFYKRVKQLEAPLSKFGSFKIRNVIKILLGRYLDAYAKTESRYFRARCNALIQQYYNVLAADFGSLKIGQIQIRGEGKDDGPAVPIGSLAPAKATPTVIGDYLLNKPDVQYERKILNESLAKSILRELQNCTSRALVLLFRTELANCLLEMGQTAIRHILFVHVEYGLDTGLRMLPPAEPKSQEPSLAFLRLIRLAMGIYDFTVANVMDDLRRLERFKAHSRKLAVTFFTAKERLEQKVAGGIEHCLNSAMHWIQVLLAQQRKGEYMIALNTASTTTSKKVNAYFTKLVDFIYETTEGVNRQSAAAELGFRYHREILDHLEVFRFTTIEGLAVEIELKEYQESARMLNNGYVNKLFDQLVMYASLLTVQQANLSKASADISNQIDNPGVVGQFVRLREDYQVPSRTDMPLGPTGAPSTAKSAKQLRLSKSPVVQPRY